MSKFKQSEINFTIDPAKDTPITLTNGRIASIDYVDNDGNKITRFNDKDLSLASGNTPVVNSININWNKGEMPDVKTGFLPESNSNESIQSTGDLLRLINEQQVYINILANTLAEISAKLDQTPN